MSVIYAFPLSVAPGPVRTNFEKIAAIAGHNNTLSDLHFFEGPGYVGLDASTTFDDATIRARGEQLIQLNLHRSEIHPDAWQPAIIRDPADTESAIARGRRREVFVSRSRQLHRPAAAHAARRARNLESATVGRVAGADLPRLLAAATGAVRLRPVEAEGRSGRAEHHAARGLARGGTERPEHQSVRAVSRMHRPSATSSSACRRRTARSICATWWTFRAATRALRRI